MALTVIPIDRTFGCVNSWLITEAFTSFIVFIYGQFSWKRTCFIIFTKLAYWPAFPTRRNARSETSCLNSFSKLEIDVQSSSRGTLFHILVYPEIIHVAPISVLHFQFWWIKWLKRWQQVGRCSIWYLTIEMGYQTSFLAPFDLPKSFLISSKFYRAFSTNVARFKEGWVSDCKAPFAISECLTATVDVFWLDRNVHWIWSSDPFILGLALSSLAVSAAFTLSKFITL